MVVADPDVSEVQRTLDRLRDFPVGPALDKEILDLVFSYLSSVSTGSNFHWFCGQASTTTVNAATFAFRLHAYSGPDVPIWKAKLEQCLSSCVDCAHAEEKAKMVSRTTYLAAFPEDIKTTFYENLEASEATSVLEILKDYGISDPPTNTVNSLFDVPVAVAFRMLSNYGIFQDVKILQIIDHYPPREPLRWPLDSLPAGILLLLLHQNPSVRNWASQQAAKCTTVPLPQDSFNGPYSHILRVISAVLSPSISITDPSILRLQATIVTDPAILWSSFVQVLKLIPPESLVSGHFQHVDIRRVLIRHLSDTGSGYAELLRCFVHLMKRLEAGLWVGEDAQYPRVVFDSIKDNPAFLSLIVNSSANKQHFTWFSEYLHWIRDPSTHGQVCLKMLNFLCEELQHDRFLDLRPAIMDLAAALLASEDKYPDRRSVVSEAFKVHGDSLISLAFRNTYAPLMWTEPRTRTRRLIDLILRNDVKAVTSGFDILCDTLARVRRNPKAPASLALTIREHIWTEVYNSLRNDDSDGIHVIISVMSYGSHLADLHKDAFKEVFDVVGMRDFYNAVSSGIRGIRRGFFDAVSAYCERSSTSSLLSVFTFPGMVQDMIKLLLSPVGDIQRAAQDLVRSAFDVDTRADCFRALITNYPNAALAGIVDFLSIFKKHANAAPEACALAKSLVHCFTDIVEVLCQHPSGLLHQPTFIRTSDPSSPTLKLPEVWNMMSQAIALIFKRTPTWAKHYPNEEMALWMRDALIFGREMLQEVQSFQSAARSLESLSAHRKSEIGTAMLNDMQQVLTDLARWLRLTDEELLHQSYSLLESLFTYFRENGSTPNKDTVDRLNRYLKDTKGQNVTGTVPPPAGAERTRLSSAKLAQLGLLLSSLHEVDDVLPSPINISDDDDEEEIPPPKKSRVKEQLPAPKPVIAKVPASKPLKPTKPLATMPAKPSVKADKGFFTERDNRKLESTVTVAKSRRTFTTGPPKTARNFPGRSSASSAPSSSDDDSNDDDEPQGSVLARMARPKSPKTKFKDKPRRQTKPMDLVVSTSHSLDQQRKREKAEREARESQFRAYQRQNPNINNLIRTLLSWNYDHDGSQPPGQVLRTSTVPDRFNAYPDYLKIFEPLVFHELWAQIVNSKENTSESYTCFLGSKSTTDYWTKVDILIKDQLQKDWYLTENDVVLLRHLHDRSKSALAKVEECRKQLGQNAGLSATLKFCFDENKPDPGLQISTSWAISKVISLSTVSREYAALATLQYYEYRDIILQPRLLTSPFVDNKVIQKSMETYKLNEPQAKAIESALRTDGFILIQGPPGTGKTSTICGLVAAATERRAQPIILGSARPSPVPKILICAPSNAAIDEITFRIKEGYRGSVKTSTPLKVVRVGSGVGEAVREVELDRLVDVALGQDDGDAVKKQESEVVALRNDVADVNKKIEEIGIELEATIDNSARAASLREERKCLHERRQRLRSQLQEKMDAKKEGGKVRNMERRRAQAAALHDAEVICTTLSGAGHKTLQDAALDFDMVIIDEAAQAIELSTLIPLKFACRRCVMVGDPKQLPPTVMSGQATKFLYNQSLFVRLQKHHPHAVHLLSIQYRMHPEISVLPSRLFYDGKLSDGPDMASKTAQPWHQDPKFGPYKIFNVRGNQENAPGKSMKNSLEAQIVSALYTRLKLRWGSRNLKIGVISPYRGQVRELQNIFRQKFGNETLELVSFNTVDGFQGQEKDIIILSTVRAGPGVQSIGFLKDVRRMNVALTRAKSSVFVVGNMPTLERSDDMWKQIINDARERELYIEASMVYFTEPSNTMVTTPPKKKPSKSAEALPPLPLDLSTPKQIMGNSRAETSRIASATKRKLSLSAEDRPRHLSNPAPSLAHEAGELVRSESSGPPNLVRTLLPRPQQPATKKKKKEANLFIPSKKPPLKRPPDGQGGGPSNKQRLS